MTKPNVYQIDLGGIREPEDLWNRLFLHWLKNIAEQNAMTLNRLSTQAAAIEKLDSAVANLQPEQSEELRLAMTALHEVEEAWQEQSARSLENVEAIAVIAKQIVARQKSE